jgi:hypothetical protein
MNLPYELKILSEHACEIFTRGLGDYWLNYYTNLYRKETYFLEVTRTFVNNKQRITIKYQETPDSNIVVFNTHNEEGKYEPNAK